MSRKDTKRSPEEAREAIRRLRESFTQGEHQRAALLDEALTQARAEHVAERIIALEQSISETA